MTEEDWPYPGFMEHFLIFIFIGAPYFAFRSNIWLGISVALFILWRIPKFNWKESKTAWGRYIYKMVS